MALLILGLAAGCSGGSDDPADGGAGGTDPTLIGTWTGTEVGGGATLWTYVFGATDASAASAGTEVYQGTYVAYPDEDPKRMALTVTDSSFAGYVGEVSRGIYRFEGGTLTFAANEPGVADTPTSFIPGGGTRVFELTKQ